MPPETFTEEEVNQMLANQEIKLRLDGVEGSINLMDERMTQNFRKEERQGDLIMKKIAEGAEERRRNEKTLRDEIYSKFVKKTDLKMYAYIIIFAVTTTVGFVTWIGAQTSANTQTRNMSQIIQQVETLLDKKFAGVKK